MAGNLINAIGLISGALGIIGFFQGNLPPAEDLPDGAVVHVKVGLEAGDEDASLVSPASAHYVSALTLSDRVELLKQSMVGTVRKTTLVRVLELTLSMETSTS